MSNPHEVNAQQSAEAVNAEAQSSVTLSRNINHHEGAEAHGVYTATLTGPREEDRASYLKLLLAIEDLKAKTRTKGRSFLRSLHQRALEFRLSLIPIEQKWADEFPNVVTTVGKNYLLDLITASGFTAVGPFMFLIDTNASTAAAGDTMASHGTWLEVGGTTAPAYTAPRKTPSFSAASAGSKATSATGFTFTSGGVVGGCGIVTGTGAVSTIDSTAGVLYSAGAFTGGSKTVAAADTLNVTYTASV